MWKAGKTACLKQGNAAMLRKTLILFPVPLLDALPFAASAETMDHGELNMFHTASLTVQRAGLMPPSGPIRARWLP